MATRSCIAVCQPARRRNRYLAVYCHHDGHPSQQMPLLKRYRSTRQVEELVAGGDLRSLEDLTRMGDSEPLEFWCIQRLLDHYTEAGCEHAYVFVPSQGWVHTDLRQLEIPDAKYYSV